MGCYLKSIAEDGETYLPGSSITLVDTKSVEYAKRIARDKKQAIR